MRRLLAALLVAQLAGCAAWRPATAPMRTIAAPAACATPVDTLLVLLPGSYSAPEEFIDEGFVRTVRAQRLAVDVLLVDAHVGYYNRRAIVDRLRDDVIAPARARGYRRIWVAGISIGAVGAMLYDDMQPGELDGIVLIAPFLGSRMAAQEIKVAGGLAAWPAPTGSTEGDIDATLWRWLKHNAAVPERARPVYLAYGRDDRFVFNDAVLAQALPASRVFTAAGGHDWSAWNPLWQRLVDAMPLPRDASCRL